MRPQSPGTARDLFGTRLAQVDADRARVADAEKALRHAQDELMSELRAYARTASQAEVDALAYDLVWFHQDLTTVSIASALGYPTARRMTDIVGPLPTGRFCARCGDEILQPPFPGPFDFEVPGYASRVCRSCRDALAPQGGYRPRF